MTIDEKLELFYQTTIEDATAESVAIIEEYESSMNEQYRKKCELIEEKANIAYQLEKEELLREKNKKISVAIRDVKRQILEEEESYKTILFSLTEKKLQKYMKTIGYEKKLEEQILHAKKVADGEEMIVYINASDKDKKRTLESKTGVSITISEMEFIGGIRVVIRSNNILIDHSFLTKLAEEKGSYRM